LQPRLAARWKPEPLPQPLANLAVAAEVFPGAAGARGQCGRERTGPPQPGSVRIDVAPKIGKQLPRPGWIDQRKGHFWRDVITHLPRQLRRIRGASDRMQQPQVVDILDLLALGPQLVR